MEIKNLFYIENTTFETLNVQFSRKYFYIYLLNLCPRAQINISQFKMLNICNDKMEGLVTSVTKI